MVSVCQHKNRHCYTEFCVLEGVVRKRFVLFFQFRDQEVNGHYFPAAGKKALAWLIPGSPISPGKGARVLGRHL